MSASPKRWKTFSNKTWHQANGQSLQDGRNLFAPPNKQGWIEQMEEGYHCNAHRLSFQQPPQ